MSKNPITGDEIATKAVNDLYRDGFDRIFGNVIQNINRTREKTAFDVLNREPGKTGSSVFGEGKDVP